MRNLAEKNRCVGLTGKSKLGRFIGEIISEHHASGSYRQHHYPVFDGGDFRVGHGSVTGSKIHQALPELLDSSSTAQCLLVYLHPGMDAVVLAKPFLIQRSGERCAGAQ